MPWGINDVSRHKKNLDINQKKKWKGMANAIYKDCIRKNDVGGFDNCEAKAVIISNSKTKTAKQKQESNMIDLYLKKTS